MEQVFPPAETHSGYAGIFTTGFHKTAADGAVTEQVGAVVLKRTYEITGATESGDGALRPTEARDPIYLADVPDNLVANSDFIAPLQKDGEPILWMPEAGVQLGRKQIGNEHEPRQLRVHGLANGRVVQTLDGSRPSNPPLQEHLGGRTFSLSFKAEAEGAAVDLNDVHLEADGEDGVVTICATNASLGSTTNSKTETWPANLMATEMRLVLRAPSDASRKVLYSDVQVEERGFATAYSSNLVLRYESDLAPVKPKVDIVVLDYTDRGQLSRVRIDAQDVLRRTVSTAQRQKSLFPWSPRNGARSAEAGSYSPVETDYPTEWPPPDPLPPAWRRDPLPNGAVAPPGDVFVNSYYNGHFRAQGGDFEGLPAAPLAADAQVLIEREVAGTPDSYGFRLPGDEADARLFHFSGGRDTRHCWSTFDVPMRLDTVVVLPARNRCYLVWRGALSLPMEPLQLRRLEVQASP